MRAEGLGILGLGSFQFRDFGFRGCRSLSCAFVKPVISSVGLVIRRDVEIYGVRGFEELMLLVLMWVEQLGEIRLSLALHIPQFLTGPSLAHDVCVGGLCGIFLVYLVYLGA